MKGKAESSDGCSFSLLALLPPEVINRLSRIHFSWLTDVQCQFTLRRCMAWVWGPCFSKPATKDLFSTWPHQPLCFVVHRRVSHQLDGWHSRQWQLQAEWEVPGSTSGMKLNTEPDTVPQSWLVPKCLAPIKNLYPSLEVHYFSEHLLWRGN